MNSNLITGRTKSRGYGGESHRPCGGHNTKQRTLTVVTELQYGGEWVGKIAPYGFGCDKGGGNCFKCLYTTDCQKGKI